MREDLNKVLCEDSRNGGLDFHWYRKQMDKLAEPYEEYGDEEAHSGDSSRMRIGIRNSKLYWDGRRKFNEHLNPLKGILRKHVGKKWDKVYSELCSVFDKRSVINQHILLHLADYVNTTDIVIREGKVHVQERYRYHRDQYVDGIVPLKKSNVQWYVDPRDGILKFNKQLDSIRTRRRQREAEHRKKQLDTKQVFKDGTEIERATNGQWWIYKYEFYPMIKDYVKRQVWNQKSQAYEMIEEYIWTYAEARDWRGQVVRQQKVCIFSKQMNSQQLKFYDVENRPLKDEEQPKFSNSKLKRLEKRLKNNAK